MKLACGSEVKIEAINADRTYAGLILGTPDEEMNQCIILHAQSSIEKYWGTRKIHLVEPEIKQVPYGDREGTFPCLPKYCLRVWLTSIEAERGDGTELVVVIYTNEDIYEKPLSVLVYEKIKDIDWKTVSEEWYF